MSWINMPSEAIFEFSANKADLNSPACLRNPKQLHLMSHILCNARKVAQPAGGYTGTGSVYLTPPLFQIQLQVQFRKRLKTRAVVAAAAPCLSILATPTLAFIHVWFFVTILAPQLRFCLGDLASESDIWHMSQAGGSSSSNTYTHTHSFNTHTPPSSYA